ncbi:MAG: PAS domain S-box protein [bacterium]
MDKHSFSFINSILFRIAAPVILVLLVVLPALYFSLYDNFSEQELLHTSMEMEWFGREIYKIVSSRYDDLVIEGLSGSELAVRVRKGLTIGIVDEFMDQNDLFGMIHGPYKEMIMVKGITLVDSYKVHETLHERDSLTLDSTYINGQRFFSYRTSFSPWGWHIYLFKDASQYVLDQNRIKNTFLIFSTVLLGGFLLLLTYLVFTFRRVKTDIVEPLQMESLPRYRGISEFEFLSETIGEMMRSLAEKNTWINNLISTAGTVIIVTDEDGEIVLFNRTGEELTSFDQDEVIGTILWDILIADHEVYRIRTEHEKLFSAGEAVSYRGHILRKDKKEVSVLFNNTLISGPDAGSRFAIYTGIDMTDLEKAEKELLIRTSQQTIIAELGKSALSGVELQEVMEMAVAAVAENLKVKHCKILELLPGGEELLLRSGVGWKEGLVGIATVGTGTDSQAGYTLNSDEPVIVKDLRTESRFTGSALLTDHEILSGVSVVIQGAAKPFGVLEVHSVSSRSFSEHDINFIKSVANVLGEAIVRKRAEEALIESEEKYRVLVENANEAIFIAQDNYIKFPNPKTLELTGYTEDELANTPFINLIHPEDRDMVVDRYTKRLRGEESPSTYSFRVIDKEGRVLWTMLNTILVTWEGKPATLNFLQDITEQKNLEAQVMQAQKMESIGTLAGGIAHDFNNLLGGILGYASLMKMDIKEGDDLFKPVDMIERSATRAADLTNQLLGFARAGKYDVKPVDLNSVVEETLGILERTLDKSVEIKKFLDSSLPPIKGDPGQLQQIIMNLCINSADAMPEGGQLILETFVENLTSSFLLSHSEAKPGPYVSISVTDTGVGMDKETVSKIFDPFFTTKEVGKGTGLGLSMVYGVVKNHGGLVNVYSEPGQGTTFRIFIPIGAGIEKKEEKEKAQPYEGNEKILVVDDEEQIRALAKDILEGFGYSVVLAASGSEAVKFYRDNRENIDMVLLDMIMPKMSGKKTFAKLKEINPDIKTLLSSGFSQTGKAQEILSEGVRDFIQKPYQVSELMLKVRSVLDSE